MDLLTDLQHELLELCEPRRLRIDFCVKAVDLAADLSLDLLLDAGHPPFDLALKVPDIGLQAANLSIDLGLKIFDLTLYSVIRLTGGTLSYLRDLSHDLSLVLVQSCLKLLLLDKQGIDLVALLLVPNGILLSAHLSLLLNAIDAPINVLLQRARAIAND